MIVSITHEALGVQQMLVNKLNKGELPLIPAFLF